MNKDARLKTAESLGNDLLHCVKDVASIESRYKKKILKSYRDLGDLLSDMNGEITDLKMKIDRTIGGKNG